MLYWLSDSKVNYGKVEIWDFPALLYTLSLQAHNRPKGIMGDNALS